MPHPWSWGILYIASGRTEQVFSRAVSTPPCRFFRWDVRTIHTTDRSLRTLNIECPINDWRLSKEDAVKEEFLYTNISDICPSRLPIPELCFFICQSDNTRHSSLGQRICCKKLPWVHSLPKVLSLSCEIGANEGSVHLRKGR